MLLKLILDNPGPYTSLDVITGRVQLQVYSNTTVSHITVKLEGESRTRLLSPPRPDGSRPRPNLEIHKLLYKVATVFPPPNSVNRAGAAPGGNFIIPPGQHSYPFQFKVPINNNCLQNQTISTNLLIPGMSLELAKAPAAHVKTTLPPSIYFPGEAEIRYYLKCTVNLPSFLKQNPRAFQAISFVPIEPPRRAQDGETYARRQHQFINDNFSPTLGDRKGSSGSIFNKMTRKESFPASPSTPTREPARFGVDARLPNPAILTCGETVPLRLLVRQISERSEVLFLKTLQVELIGFTHIRAHDAVRTESNSWVLVSMANINQSIGTVADAVGTETEISQEFWYGQKLPDSVPPSFTACNISRKYQLKVSAGLEYGGMHGRNQFIVLPLDINVEVFSGIKPPPELLKRTENNPPRRKPIPSQDPSLSMGGEPSSVGLPAQSAPGYDDAPPSYEDATAETIPPVDGPRPGYRPPPDTGDEESRITDSKR